MKQKLALTAIVTALSGTAWMIGSPAFSAEEESQLQSPQGGTAQQRGQEQAQGREQAQGQEQAGKRARTQEQAQGQGAPLYIGPSGVREVQQALKQADHDPGSVDGIWGEGTQKALRDFQQEKGLEPTGNLNIETIHALGLGSLLQGQTGRSTETQTGVEPKAKESESSETQDE